MIENILTGLITVGLMLATVYYLFIYVDPAKKGCLSAIKRFLYTTIPSLMLSTVQLVFGEAGLLFVNKNVHYLCYSRNPAV
jgi:hypothetical protein